MNQSESSSLESTEISKRDLTGMLLSLTTDQMTAFINILTIEEMRSILQAVLLICGGGVSLKSVRLPSKALDIARGTPPKN